MLFMYVYIYIIYDYNIYAKLKNRIRNSVSFLLKCEKRGTLVHKNVTKKLVTQREILIKITPKVNVKFFKKLIFRIQARLNNIHMG